MIWLPVTVLLISLPAFIVWAFREIRRLERRLADVSADVGDLQTTVAGLKKQVAELEDEVIGLLKPKGQL